MRITLLVENFMDDKIQTPGEHIFHFIEATKKYNLALSDAIQWIHPNRDLILKWHHQDNFNLQKIKNFNITEHENPHYLINFGNSSIYMPGVFSLISEDAKKIIKKHNIPILFFAPLEINNSPTEAFFSDLCDARDENGLENISIKILTLDTFFKDKEYTPLPIKEMYSSLKSKNIKWIQSVAWIDYYNINSIFLPGEYFNTLLNGKEINLKDHESAEKPYICLTLNNKARPNRQLLTFALHVFKDKLSKILYSQHFETKKDDLFNIFYGDLYKYNLSSVIKIVEVVDKLISEKSNLSGTILESYLANESEDSFLKTTLSLYKSIINENYSPAQQFQDNSDFMPEQWNTNWYLTSWCSIVTETYEPRPTESPMVTEKTVKAILNYHPFYVFGHNHNNTMLAELGFRTFEKSWFNMPLEGTPGNNSMLERVHNLIQSLKYLSSLSQEELRAKYQSIKEDLEFNRNHLLKNDWGQLQNKFIMNPY